MADGPPSIVRDELIYRRIPCKQHWVSGGIASPHAFLPNKGDTIKGVSLSRAMHGESPEQTAQRVAAKGYIGTDYHVVAMPASVLLDAGIPVVPSGTVDDPTHAEAEGWTYDKRNDSTVRTGAEKAAASVVAVYGPYPGQKPRPQPPSPAGPASLPGPAPADPPPR
jgi:hypothetical protein